MVGFTKAIVICLLGLVLAACDAGRKNPFASSLPRQVSKEDILKNYVLLDQAGLNQPVREGARGLSPFLAVLNLSEADWTQCNGAQTFLGIASTAGHCVTKRAVEAGDVYIIYFNNRTGKQGIVQPEKLVYLGDESFDDIALLRIPSDIAAQIDVASQDLWDPVRHYGAPSEARGKEFTEDLVIWAYDPLDAHPETIAATGAKFGMQIQPVVCQGFRASPLTSEWDKNNQRVDIRPLTAKNKKVDPNRHLYLDGCSTQSGNSGALIANRRFDQFVGVFHWNLLKSRFKTNEDFMGSGDWINVWKQLPGDESRAVLQVGSTFDGLFKKKPELLHEASLSTF